MAKMLSIVVLSATSDLLFGRFMWIVDWAISFEFIFIRNIFHDMGWSGLRFYWFLDFRIKENIATLEFFEYPIRNDP